PRIRQIPPRGAAVSCLGKPTETSSIDDVRVDRIDGQRMDPRACVSAVTLLNGSRYWRSPCRRDLRRFGRHELPALQKRARRQRTRRGERGHVSARRHPSWPGPEEPVQEFMTLFQILGIPILLRRYNVSHVLDILYTAVTQVHYDAVTG